MRRAVSLVIMPLVIGSIFLLLWQLAPFHSLILPKPYAVLERVIRDISRGVLTKHSWITLQEVLLGFALSSVVAIFVGILIAEFGFLRLALYPYLIAIQATPIMAIAPIIILIFGYGILSKVIIGALIAFFPMLVNTINGLQAVDRELIDLMRSYTATKWEILTKVKIPHSLPYIFTGLETSVVICVVGVIIGEFIGSAGGLGHYIISKQFNLETDAIFSALIVLSLMGMFLYFVVQLIHRKVVFWEGK